MKDFFSSPKEMRESVTHDTKTISHKNRGMIVTVVQSYFVNFNSQRKLFDNFNENILTEFSSSIPNELALSDFLIILALRCTDF
jgi:hypothetical protein